jgi:hypothetical protein
MKKNFINAIVLLAVSVILPAFAYCQSNANHENYLESLPRQLKLDEKTPQQYLMITDAFDYDLSGNFIKKTRYTGEYTRGMENGNSRWNNVRISIVNRLDGAFSSGEKQEAMENFMYKSEPSKEIFSNSFFSKIPEPNTLNNSFNCDYLQVVVNGNSCVWGSVYVSLIDKQIEYAGLYEDILMDIKIKGQENSIRQKTYRHITLNKIQ